VSQSTWLPNLVGGTSIWKLAVDLNESKFFDGRLLVPETEGSESLPVTVRWDLTGLIPLADARQKHPEEAAAAVKDFQSALERVAKVFATPNSGFDKYKDAFTVPSLDADGGANYFYSTAQKKLFAINWGASPRSMGGKAEYVFGYEDWGKHWHDGTAGTGAAVAAAGVVGAAAVAANLANPSENKKEEKKAATKKNEKARPWWIWPLFGLVAIALVLLALFLVKACEEQKVVPGADASDAPLEGATSSDGAIAVDAGADDAAVGAEDGGAANDGAAAGDGGDDARADAATADGGDAGAGKDGGADGGVAMGDEDDDDFPEGSSGAVGSSGGSSGKPVVVKIGPGGGEKTSVHRKHYSNDATHWRVATGADKVSRTEESGHRFDVWLAPGQTFEGVRIEWQDKAGQWHVH
jgi:hypothetical protein